MKISEFINKLQEIQEKCGDCYLTIRGFNLDKEDIIFVERGIVIDIVF